MLSYPIPEATELLTGKLGAARQSLSNCEEDLDFLREQITVRLDFPLCQFPPWGFLVQRGLVFPFLLSFASYTWELGLTSIHHRQWKSPRRACTTGTSGRSGRRRRRRAAERILLFTSKHYLVMAGHPKFEKPTSRYQQPSHENKCTRPLGVKCLYLICSFFAFFLSVCAAYYRL